MFFVFKYLMQNFFISCKKKNKIKKQIKALTK